MLDKEFDEIYVVRNQAVRSTKFPRIGLSELRVIAAAPLRYVMKNRSDVKKPVPVKPGHQAAAKRIFVRKLHHREPPQVPYNRENVLIDGVDMKQVVLHLTDYPSECRYVASKNTVLIHSSEFMYQTPGLPEDLEEARFVGGILSKVGVNQPP